MRVTMKQIAQRANVSRGAVSAVLNDVAAIRVSPSNRLKILKIAEEMNYRPDFAAIALKTGKTGLLGFIGGGLRLPFFAELADRLMEASNHNGYQLIMMPIDWALHNDIECLQKMIDMADGLFLCSNILNEHEKGRQVIATRKIPVVLLNENSPGVSSVTFDFHVGMKKAFSIDHK